MRFLRDCSLRDLYELGAARLNILRDDEVCIVGDRLLQRFGTPYIPSFPVGFAGTIRFLESVADGFGVKCTRAIREERALQDEIRSEFEDITGTIVTFDPAVAASAAFPVACEVAGQFNITVDREGCTVPLQVSPPVGTNGIRHMLHRWRRAIHA
jgi:hypothetical protein